MMKRIVSIIPLLIFITLVALSGYVILRKQRPSQAAVVTPNPPTATATATPTRIITVTPSSTPSPVPATPTVTPTSPPPSTPTPTPIPPTPLPTVAPLTLIWVRTDNSNPIDPTHTLGLNAGSDIQNPELQAYGVAPALSSDGSRVAFFAETNLSGFNTGIWIDEITDGVINDPQLLADVTDVQNIAWSPDGDKLAFEIIVNPFEPQQAWRSQVRVIRANPEDGYVQLGAFDGRQPAWSPDSQYLVTQGCKGSECGLFVTNCIGGNCDFASAERITTDVSDSYPAWSVNGKIAFTSRREGSQDIYLLDLASGMYQNLTQRPSTDITPVFGSDGQRIYFRTDFPEGAKWQIQAITLDESRQAVQSIETVLADVGGDDQNWGLVRPAVR